MWGNMKRKSECVDALKESEVQGRKRKETRTIKMGWGLVSETGLKIMRSNQGGGPTHNFTVSKQCTKADLIAMGKHIFFPNQKCPIGHESEFTFDIQLGRGISMEDDDTLESFFVASKNSYLRLYLACIRRTDLPHIRHRSFSDCQDQMTLINDSEFDSEIVSSRDPSSNDAVYLYKEIHLRGAFIFEDFINEFSGEFWMDCDYSYVYVNVVVTLGDGNNTVTNEEKEMTFKKCLTVFWKEFYNKYTKGAKCKVPSLVSGFDEVKWCAVAKVLAIGWIKLRYFPILLSPPFINFCLDQEPVSDMTEPFLLYLQSVDSRIIHSAISDFNSVDKGEIMRVFSDLNLKIDPASVNQSNISQVIREIAYLIHIQQPYFIISCWRNELKNVAQEITQESLQEIYKNLIPTSERLVTSLRFDQMSSGRHESACGFLRRFLRDSDQETLARFLQFISGCDLLTVDEIFIAFSDESGFSKPDSNSVDSFEADLIVSTCYNNYDDFQNELNNILNTV